MNILILCVKSNVYLSTRFIKCFQVEARKRANNTDMLTGDPLIKKGETVEEFVGRYWK